MPYISLFNGSSRISVTTFLLNTFCIKIYWTSQINLPQIECDTYKAQLDKVKMKLGIIECDKETVEAKSRDLKVIFQIT